VGDVLLAVGDEQVAGTPDWSEAFRAAYRDKEGAPLAIKVRRNGVEQALAGTVRLQTHVDYHVTRDEDAGRLETEIFQGLVGGR
jgi:hypothetical protein